MKFFNYWSSNNGEEIALYAEDVFQNELIDYIGFGLQSKDISYGRIPDGSDMWDFADVSQDAIDIINRVSLNLKYYPNPVISKLHLSSHAYIKHVVLKSIDGKIVRMHNVQNTFFELDFSYLNDGIYIL